MRAIIGLVAVLPLLGADWRGLQVAEEHRCTPYDSDEYSYTPATLESAAMADLGGVYSPYTGEWLDSPSQTDVEHIVARSEAHDSGMCSASADVKRQFATDMLNIALAPAALNRWEKSGKDAGEWMPESNRCWFADTVVKVKTKYGLTVDVLEAAALEKVLRRCPSADMLIAKR